MDLEISPYYVYNKRTSNEDHNTKLDNHHIMTLVCLRFKFKEMTINP